MKLTFLIIVLIISSRLAPVVGGLIWMATTYPLKMPSLRPVFRRIVASPLHLGGAIKPATWVVGGSGPAGGLFIYIFLFGEPKGRWQLLAILIAAIISQCHLVQNLLSFELHGSEDLFVEIAPRLFDNNTLEAFKQSDKLQKRILFSSFLDLRMLEFFIMTSSYGCMYYAMGKLGIFGVGGNWKSASEPFIDSLANASLLAASENSIVSWKWDAINTIQRFFIFIWAACLLSLAQELIPESFRWNKEAEKSGSELAKMREGIQHVVDNAVQANSDNNNKANNQ